MSLIESLERWASPFQIYVLTLDETADKCLRSLAKASVKIIRLTDPSVMTGRSLGRKAIEQPWNTILP